MLHNRMEKITKWGIASVFLIVVWLVAMWIGLTILLWGLRLIGADL